MSGDPKKKDCPLPDAVELKNLAKRYKTDKVRHGFIPIYSSYLKSFRQKAKFVIEIGIKYGASLKMWHDYFPKATIVGIDNMVKHDPSIWAKSEFESRVIVWKADQSNPKDLSRFIYQSQGMMGKVDLIVDDGSHKMYDQQLTLAKLFVMLRPGGIYVIEDLDTSLAGGPKNKFGIIKDDQDTTLCVLERARIKKKIQVTSRHLADLEVNRLYLCKHIAGIDIYRLHDCRNIIAFIRKIK